MTEFQQLYRLMDINNNIRRGEPVSVEITLHRLVCAVAQTQLLVVAAEHPDVPTLAVFVTATKVYRNICCKCSINDNK